MPSSDIVFTVLFDNESSRSDLHAAHGFSCLIEHPGGTLLFDTGGDSTILLANMAALGKDPAAVDTIVISHPHWDHSGGLFGFLHAAGTTPRVFLPKATSKEFIGHAELLGAAITVIEDPTEIARGILSTGQMDTPKGEKDRREQSLVLDTADGPIVLTGCAHPGVEHIAKRAVALCPGKPAYVMGGFHLRDAGDSEVAGVIATLKGLGVRRVGTSHCTGRQVAAFRDAWGADFVAFGVGSVVRAAA